MDIMLWGAILAVVFGGGGLWIHFLHRRDRKRIMGQREETVNMPDNDTCAEMPVEENQEICVLADIGFCSSTEVIE